MRAIEAVKTVHSQALNAQAVPLVHRSEHLPCGAGAFGKDAPAKVKVARESAIGVRCQYLVFAHRREIPQIVQGPQVAMVDTSSIVLFAVQRNMVASGANQLL